MRLDLPDVATERLPASDLSRIVLMTAAHGVAAVPLKPAARIVLVQPALPPPFGERLARIDLEIVEPVIALSRREFRARKPAFGKLLAAVGQVEAAEHAERQHLGRRQLG